MHIRMFRRKELAGIALAASFVGSPGGALAAQAKRARPSRADLEERVRVLEEKLERALQKQEIGTKGAAKAPADAGAVDQETVKQIVDDKLKSQKMLAGWQDGFFLQSPSGDFKLKLRGYAQADARFFPLEGGDTGTDSLFLRRVRPIFEGTVYKYFDFRIMPDFGGGQTVLQDGWARLNYWPYAQVTAGKFKSPVSLERLQGGSELTFIERSIANNLAPNREVGVTLGGSVADGVFNYQLGIFNGQFDGGNNDGDVTSDKDLEGRFWVEPFRRTDVAPLKGLGFGVGGSHGNVRRESISALTYRTAGRSTFFKFDTSDRNVSIFADGDRVRLAPAAYWYYGPFGLMGEYIHSEGDLLQETATDGDPLRQQGSIVARGWFAQASALLTGEQATFKQVAPINSFDPVNGRWGAVEIAARVSGVDVNDGVFRRGIANRGEPGDAGDATESALAYTAGLNWYFNKNFKLQLDWEHTEFDDEVQFGRYARDHEDAFISRFQISY